MLINELRLPQTASHVVLEVVASLAHGSSQVWWGLRLSTITPSRIALTNWNMSHLACSLTYKSINNIREVNAHTLLLAYLGRYLCLDCQSSPEAGPWICPLDSQTNLSPVCWTVAGQFIVWFDVTHYYNTPLSYHLSLGRGVSSAGPSCLGRVVIWAELFRIHLRLSSWKLLLRLRYTPRTTISLRIGIHNGLL